MAVDRHPSRRPTPPRRPPATSTTAGTINKIPESASGQAGVPYGACHELNIKPSHKSEMAHHFEDSGKLPGHAKRPGDENKADEPG